MLESAELLNSPRRPESFAHWKTANGPGKQRLVAGSLLCLLSVTVGEITAKEKKKERKKKSSEISRVLIPMSGTLPSQHF